MAENQSAMFEYLVNGGDELALAKAQIEHLSGCLGFELDENERLRAALTALVNPDDFDKHPQDFMPEWHAARALIGTRPAGTEK